MDNGSVMMFGGGELGMMAAQAAEKLGISILGINPVVDCSIAQVPGTQVVAGNFDDVALIRSLASRVRGATIEIETTDPACLRALVEAGVPTFPQPGVLAVMRDRARQKRALSAAGIPVVPYSVADSITDLRLAYHDINTGNGAGRIVKTCLGAYNGSSQFKMTYSGQAEAAWAACGKRRCTIEAALELRAELCVMVARHPNGTRLAYPPALTHHHHQFHIMEWAVIPAPLPEAMVKEAQAIALAVAEQLDVHGMLAVEMFVVGDKLFVNECAVRFHNGGHPTRIGCRTSQFSQGIRLAAGMPLGPIDLIGPTAMVNLLCGLYHHPGVPDSEMLDGHDDVWYYKQARDRRKMGHVACQNKSPFEALIAAHHAYDELFVEPRQVNWQTHFGELFARAELLVA